MSPKADVSLSDDNTIVVRGRLDVDTVAKYKDAGVRLFQDLERIVFDLGGTEVQGSAVIALLIAWQREALKTGKSMSITHAPDRLLEIARACGVQDIVPFD